LCQKASQNRPEQRKIRRFNIIALPSPFVGLMVSFFAADDGILHPLPY
jgi:hypothetical protein